MIMIHADLHFPISVPLSETDFTLFLRSDELRSGMCSSSLRPSSKVATLSCLAWAGTVETSGPPLSPLHASSPAPVPEEAIPENWERNC